MERCSSSGQSSATRHRLVIPAAPPLASVVTASCYNPPNVGRFWLWSISLFFKLSAYIYFPHASVCSTSVISLGYSAVDFYPSPIFSILKYSWKPVIWQMEFFSTVASQTLFQQIILFKYPAWFTRPRWEKISNCIRHSHVHGYAHVHPRPRKDLRVVHANVKQYSTLAARFGIVNPFLLCFFTLRWGLSGSRTPLPLWCEMSPPNPPPRAAAALALLCWSILSAPG